MKVALVASAGGHLTHLLWLEGFWREQERWWVSFELPDAVSRLAGEDVVWAPHPTNRHPLNLLRNARLARRELLVRRPDLVVSSGAGLAVPWLWQAHLLGIRTCFIEVADRVQRPSASAKLCARFVDELVITDARQRVHFPQARYLGAPR